MIRLDRGRLFVWLAAASVAACNSGGGDKAATPPSPTQRIASWTACYDTVTSRNIPVQREASPQLAGLSDGGLVAVWIQCDGSRSNVWSSVFQSASGWSAPQPVGSGSDDRFPALAVNANGDATTLWSAANRVWENRYTRAAGWGQARPLDIGDLGTPAVYMRRGGDAVAVWPTRSATASSLWASRRVAGTWSRAEAINVAAGDFAFASAADGAANVTVMWVDAAGSLWSARYAFDSGWSAAERLADTRAVEPAIAESSDGRVTAVWRETPSSAVMSRFSTGSGWSPAIRVDKTDQDPPSAPQVDLGSGGGVGAWHTQNLREIWANRLADDGSWAVAIRIGGGQNPVIAVDDKGNAAAAWIASPSDGLFRLDGAHLAGATWSLSGAIRPGEAVGQVGRPALVVGSDAYVEVMWAAQAHPLTAPDVVELWTSRTTLR